MTIGRLLLFPLSSRTGKHFASEHTGGTKNMALCLSPSKPGLHQVSSSSASHNVAMLSNLSCTVAAGFTIGKVDCAGEKPALSRQTIC